MNLISSKNLLNKNHSNVALLINNVSKNSFIAFIKAIIQKQSWSENLCSCDFHINESQYIYIFEADDDNEEDILYISYIDVLHYVKYVAQKYIDMCNDEEEIFEINNLIKELDFMM
ncbi:MAG: hypothetical protein R3Y29_05255 [bacterium]